MKYQIINSANEHEVEKLILTSLKVRKNAYSAHGCIMCFTFRIRDKKLTRSAVYRALSDSFLTASLEQVIKAARGFHLNAKEIPVEGIVLFLYRKICKVLEVEE